MVWVKAEPETGLAMYPGLPGSGDQVSVGSQPAAASGGSSRRFGAKTACVCALR